MINSQINPKEKANQLKLIEDEIKKLDKKMDSASFSVDLLWREIVQLYNTDQKNKLNDDMVTI